MLEQREHARSPHENGLDLEKIHWQRPDETMIGNGLIVIRPLSHSHWKPESRQNCADMVEGWLATHGNPAKSVTLDGALVMETGHYNTLLEYRWPRNMAWTDLPISRDAQFKLRQMSVSILDRWGDFKPGQEEKRIHYWSGMLPQFRASVWWSINTCTSILLDSPQQPDTRILDSVYHALRCYRETGKPSPVIGWFDGKHVQEITQTALYEASTIMRAHHRFEWSHTVNACILMRRAYAEALAGFPRDADAICSNDAFRIWDRYGYVPGTPWGLQMMHVLNSNSRAHSQSHGMPENEQTPERKTLNNGRAGWLNLQKGTPFCEFTDPASEQGQVAWKGTGRYPTLYGSMNTSMIDMHVTHPLQFNLLLLPDMGLICFDENGRVVTTRIGSRFMDIIGTATRDPDVLLRWRNKDSLHGTHTDIPAMDRWLHRVFRETKRRVQHLPDGGPFRRYLNRWEEDGTYLEDLPDNPVL